MSTARKSKQLLLQPSKKSQVTNVVWIIMVGNQPFCVQNVAMAVHFSLLLHKTADPLQFYAYINFTSLRMSLIHRSFTLLLQ